MARKSQQDSRQKELIPVIYALNMTEAEFYRSLLEEQDILVVIQKNNLSDKPSPSKDLVLVLVPEDSLTEAQNIIEQREQADDEIEAEFDDFFGPHNEIYDYDQPDHDITNTDLPDDMD